MMQEDHRWNEFSELSYQLTKSESRSVYVSGQAIRLLWPVLATQAALFVILGTVLVTWSHGSTDRSMGFVVIGAGVLFAGLIVAVRRGAFQREQCGCVVRIDAHAVTIQRGQMITLSRWSSISSIIDQNDVFVLMKARDMRIAAVIPKRIFADRGTLLWTLLEDRLIGRHRLLRRADARIIINTASIA